MKCDLVCIGDVPRISRPPHGGRGLKLCSAIKRNPPLPVAPRTGGVD